MTQNSIVMALGLRCCCDDDLRRKGKLLAAITKMELVDVNYQQLLIQNRIRERKTAQNRWPKIGAYDL